MKIRIPVLLFLAMIAGSAFAQSECDRGCLETLLDDYLVAMRDQDAANPMFDPALKFTENGIHLPFGSEGLWYGMSGLGGYKLYVPDIEARTIAFLGTVREGGTGPDDGDVVAVAIRLKLNDNDQISEIEQLAIRPDSTNSSQGDFAPTGEMVEAMGSPHPMWLETIPEAERMTREELAITGDWYFEGLQRNDGQGYYPFTEDCVRDENGNRSTNDCLLNFQEQVRNIVDRIRDRRWVAMDRERGIAFAFGFFDHHRINWTWQLAELFKIENGKMRRVEAIFHRAPFGSNSGWSTFEQGMSEEIQIIK